MIINTELEQKGDLFPTAITAFRQEADTVFFSTDNNVILKVTVLRASNRLSDLNLLPTIKHPERRESP